MLPASNALEIVMLMGPSGKVMRLGGLIERRAAAANPEK
jgi:hypothetical protein